MKKPKIRFGFEILTESGPISKPIGIQVSTPSNEKSYGKPLKYMADALVGLSLIRLNPSLQCPIYPGGLPQDLCHQAWNHLDAHHTLYSRSHDRVQALKSKLQSKQNPLVQGFEKSFSETLAETFTTDGIDLKDTWGLLDAITFLESKISSPLLFNFGLSFSKTFVERLHNLYCLLFHLRSLIAIDFNAHVLDPSHEALKIDSVTDYLPKSDYIVNDALLYHSFKKLSFPFVAGKNSDVRIEKLLVQPMIKHFEQYNHNAVYLIDQLPKDFLSNFRATDLEEALYLLQMDWLLGSEAGLLFRLREELYGLLNGYEKIFWPERDQRRALKSVQLALHFELSEEDWTSSKAA